jgi:hypothetical protein
MRWFKKKEQTYHTDPRITIVDRYDDLERRIEALEVVVRTAIKDGERNGN